MLSENKKRVWVKNGELIKPIMVETGMTDGINLEIISGLNAGDEIVTSMDLGISSSLYYDELLILLGLLGIPPNTEFQSAWLYRGYNCDVTQGPYFEQPSIFVTVTV